MGLVRLVKEVGVVAYLRELSTLPFHDNVHYKGVLGSPLVAYFVLQRGAILYQQPVRPIVIVNTIVLILESIYQVSRMATTKEAILLSFTSIGGSTSIILSLLACKVGSWLCTIVHPSLHFCRILASHGIQVDKG